MLLNIFENYIYFYIIKSQKLNQIMITILFNTFIFKIKNYILSLINN